MLISVWHTGADDVYLRVHRRVPVSVWDGAFDSGAGQVSHRHTQHYRQPAGFPRRRAALQDVWSPTQDSVQVSGPGVCLWRVKTNNVLWLCMYTVQKPLTRLLVLVERRRVCCFGLRVFIVKHDLKIECCSDHRWRCATGVPSSNASSESFLLSHFTSVHNESRK